MHSPDPKLLEVIHSIYAVALEPSLWPKVVRNISDLVGADAGTLWVHDFCDSSATVDGNGPNIAAFVGIDMSAIQTYAQHYSALNVWTGAEEQMPEGTVVTSSALYPDALLKRTEFYGDWLRHLDLFYALGTVVEKQGSRAVKMSFLRPERSGGYGEHALQVMRTLMPHLQTAIAIHRRMHSLQGMNQAAFHALERSNFGVLLLGPDAELRHANSRALEIGRRTRAFAANARGYLEGLTPSLTARLHGAVHRAALAGGGMGIEPATTLLLRDANGGELRAVIVPMPPAAQHFPGDVAAMMFVADPDSALPNFAQKLRLVYGISPSEAQLAEALVGGKSLKQFAEERGTSLNTVRTQLKSLAAKVGAKRQVDVVRCILTGPAVLDM